MLHNTSNVLQNGNQTASTVMERVTSNQVEDTNDNPDEEEWSLPTPAHKPNRIYITTQKRPHTNLAIKKIRDEALIRGYDDESVKLRLGVQPTARPALSIIA